MVLKHSLTLLLWTNFFTHQVVTGRFRTAIFTEFKGVLISSVHCERKCKDWLVRLLSVTKKQNISLIYTSQYIKYKNLIFSR